MRSVFGAVVRLIVAPLGAHAWTYLAQSELSSYWGYGSQKPICVTAVDALPDDEEPVDPPPQAASDVATTVAKTMPVARRTFGVVRMMFPFTSL